MILMLGRLDQSLLAKAYRHLRREGAKPTLKAILRRVKANYEGCIIIRTTATNDAKAVTASMSHPLSNTHCGSRLNRIPTNTAV